MIKLTETVKHLIIINVLFFLATIALNEKLINLFAMHHVMNPLFKPWQIVTHMFMHGNVQHILFNMIGLWMFGSTVEDLIGRNKFLIIYFVAGIGAVLFSLGIDYFLHQGYYTTSLGASGALYGIMVAFGVLMPKAKMGLLFLPIMIEARIFIPLLLLSDILFGVFRANSNVGHFAHIGGAIFGFLIIMYYKKKYQS